ncbi:leucyl/phenylalanyl-tRNA--protein transferase [Brucepastera parasyntrophica]|uniref:leucyl/phenylalanyl-tRNA--protein transferase n=1 Tax=Brucepastera parasyntrophica TaxID=2880008 RepID=UPI00210A5C95|nr:leucyl/phenylalanyl-tRNA--protein transferase [Brucepastera parasyntrophica]ULQ59350.1 leucyl/phenylalanyl-tRNA--protein transferase [Brucepastera parasyntrophica]
MTDGEKKRQTPDFPFLEIDTFFRFPEPEDTDSTVVAVGGNLSPGMLVSAYTQGIFPWFNDDDPLLWHSPDPRFVILPETFHIPSRLAREIKRYPFEIRVDTAFERVITFCSSISRPDQDSTWITDDIIEAYIRLHREGLAHSVEAWKGNELAGGFFGVHIGQAFFGESMFTRIDGASKAAFAIFAGYFFSHMQGKFIDSQVYTDHIARFGGVNISRYAYLRKLNEALGFSPDRTEINPGNILEKRGLWPSGMLQNA